MSTQRTTTVRTRRRSLAAGFAVAVAVLATGCGSQLTEAQVLSRSGAQTATSSSLGQQPGTTGSLGQQPAPGAGQPSSSAITGGNAPASTQAKPGAEPIAGTSNSATAKAAAPGSAQAGGSAGAGCNTKGSGPIKIASVGNYSGAGGAAQGGYPKAVQVWAAAQNAKGGLCGRPVQVLVADDGGDPSTYAAKIKDMVENQHVVAFVSNGAVLSAHGGKAYHKSSGVPVIGNDCAVRSLYWTDPIYAPTCSYLDQGLVNTMRVGVKLSGKKKLGVLYCREAEVCAAVNEVVSKGGDREAGAQLVNKASISVAQIDFTAECQNARAAGVDLMYVAADGATISRIAQSCARQGFRPQYVVGPSISGETAKVDGLKNIIIQPFIFPFTGATSPAIAEYDKARQQFAPNVTPDPGYATAWTGAKLFELLGTRAAKATGDITPAALRAALLTVKGETLGGLTAPLFYSSSGSMGIKNCYFAMQGNGNGGYKAPFGAAAQCVG